MGNKVSEAVWDYSQSKGGDLTVLLAIADNADNVTAIAFPKIEYLAKKSRLSVRAVQYSISRLKKMGELSVLEGFGRGRMSFYRVDLHLKLRLVKGASLAPFTEAEIVQTLHLLTGRKGANGDNKRCNPRQEKVQTATNAIERARDTLEPSLEPSLTSLSQSLSNTLNKDEREILIKDLKRLFPDIVSIPTAIPMERAYLFLYKVRRGEIRKESLYSPVAYLAKMHDEDISDLLQKERTRKATAQVEGKP